MNSIEQVIFLSKMRGCVIKKFIISRWIENELNKPSDYPDISSYFNQVKMARGRIRYYHGYKIELSDEFQDGWFEVVV